MCILRALTVKLLKIIVFNNSKNYFIYFNNLLYNTPNIKASKIFSFSFKYSFLLLFLFLFSCFITFHLKYSFLWERLSVWETNKIQFAANNSQLQWAAMCFVSNINQEYETDLFFEVTKLN